MPLDHELSMVKNMIIVKKMTKLFNELDQHGIYFVLKTLVSLKSQIRLCVFSIIIKRYVIKFKILLFRT